MSFMAQRHGIDPTTTLSYVRARGDGTALWRDQLDAISATATASRPSAPARTSTLSCRPFASVSRSSLAHAGRAVRNTWAGRAEPLADRPGVRLGGRPDRRRGQRPAGRLATDPSGSDRAAQRIRGRRAAGLGAVDARARAERAASADAEGSTCCWSGRATGQGARDGPRPLADRRRSARRRGRHRCPADPPRGRLGARGRHPGLLRHRLPDGLPARPTPCSAGSSRCRGWDVPPPGAGPRPRIVPCRRHTGLSQGGAPLGDATVDQQEPGQWRTLLEAPLMAGRRASSSWRGRQTGSSSRTRSGPGARARIRAARSSHRAGLKPTSTIVSSLRDSRDRWLWRVP